MYIVGPHPLAAVDTHSIAYSFGQFVAWAAFAAAVIWAIRKVLRRRRSDKEDARLEQEQRSQRDSRLAAPSWGRIVYEDGHSEDLQISRASVPDALMRLQNARNTSVEIVDPGKGTLRIGIDRGTAIITWDSLLGPFRYLGPSTAGSTGQTPDGPYRIGIGDAIAVVQGWTENGEAPFGSWERPEPRPSP